MSVFYDVEQVLAGGDPVLTPGPRLAQALQTEWALQRRARGEGAWRKPPVYNFREFLQLRWQQLLHSGDAEVAGLFRIDGNAERALWEKIIDDDPQCELLQPGAAAAHARQAHALLQRWRIDPGQEKYATEFRLSSDGQRFLHWRREFLQLCAARGWCSDGAMEEHLLRAFTTGILEPLPRLLLYGFEPLETLPPLRRALLEAMACELQCVAAPPGNPQKTLLECPDPEQEVYAAALWARRIVQEDPGTRIAVALPELDQHRTMVERAFREVFSPGDILPDAPPSEGLFNIAAPRPLARAPLVEAAVQLLELVCTGLAPERLRALLDSPFLLTERESPEALGVLAARLLEWRGERVSSGQLQQLATACGAETLASTLRELAAAQRETHSMHWEACFRDWLRALGWPGSRSPDSAEYQQLQRLDRVWEQFAASAEVYGSLRPAQALQCLKKLLQDISFQPRGGRVQVEVLTLQETRGLRFDHLWLCGMEQSLWPMPTEPNPLLPGPLQRSCGMPHADAQREREGHARLVAELQLTACHSLTVSYPAAEEERELGIPSFFFAELERQTPGELLNGTENPQRQWVEQLRASGALQPLPEDRPAPCSAGPVSGTVSLLQDQAACSFRAYAHHRLGVSGRPHHARPILDAAERGNIAHLMLQFFWDEVHDSSTLRECPPEQLERLIADAAAQAVEDTILNWQRQGAAARPRFWELERRRLRANLQKWLQKELEHADEEGDFEVSATEEQREFQLEDLMHFRLRIDHVEKRENRQLVLMDYKTGRAAGRSASTAQRLWEGPYPEDPQLPLYALACADEAPLHALGWGFVDVRELERALCSSAELEGVSWEELRRQWQQNFVELAREYRQGGAEVRPRLAKACEHCAMQALCRIRELS